MRTIPLIAALLTTTAPALAAPVTSNALVVPAGPSARDTTMGLVWIAQCPADDRLVGIRLLSASGFSGVVAICAPLQPMLSGMVWAADPMPVKGPPLPPPPVMVTREVVHELHGRISRPNDAGVYEDRALLVGALVVEETVPDPSTPPGPPVIAFKQKSHSDIMCPQNAFVKGIRYQTPVAGGVAAVELVCAQDGMRVVSVAAVTKKRSGKVAPVERDIANRQRIDCRGMSANPDDGEAVDAVFGTLDEAGRVQSIGLSCAPAIEPAGVARRFGATMAKLSAGFLGR